MNLRKTWVDLDDIAGRFGFAAAATEILSLAFGRLCDGKCHVVDVVTSPALPAEDPSPSTDEAPRFLSDEEILATAALDPELFDEAFATAARARGDECIACFRGDRVVSIGWYTRQPSRMPNGFWVKFSSHYIYGYKSQTLAPFRGKRLAGLRGEFAVRSYAQRGYRGIIGYIDANNFPQLRNVARLGGRRVGTFLTWRMLGRHRAITSRGCRAYGFTVGREP